jgi:heterodisulfide reductase subunit B
MSSEEEHSRPYVDQVVGEPYRGEVRVRHVLEVILQEYGLEALQEKVKHSLRGLRVAAYYGCLLVRPPEATAFDDPEDPTCMEALISALGGEPVDWPYKTECCGGSLSLTRTNIILKLGHDILQMAADQGAECVMVACPLCQSSLDLRQAQVNRRYKTDFYLPVLYFTQLAGLALGIEASELSFGKHMVDPKKLLQDKGLI